jgi:Abi-like protein.
MSRAPVRARAATAEAVLHSIPAQYLHHRARALNRGGNRKAAFGLYSWNIAVSAALYGPLQTLEGTLRNALHNASANCYDPY